MPTKRQLAFRKDQNRKYFSKEIKVHGTNMPRRRYDAISMGLVEELTQEDLDDGWHFCDSWDQKLIHKFHAEFEGCSCDRTRRKRG